MAALKMLPLAWVLLLLLVPRQSYPQTLYTQSLQSSLARDYPALELVVVDLKTGEVRANTFRHPADPIPPGSLLKPFLAAADPGRLRVSCHGHADRCWRVHGDITLSRALAESCNAYFLAVAQTLDPTRIPMLPPPPPNASPADLIGLTPRWRILPGILAQAYAGLLTSASTPVGILAGLADAASNGTASGLQPMAGAGRVLAKTGTAPCIVRPCAAQVDGLVVIALPAQDFLILARHRASTGAQTAVLTRPVLLQLVHDR